LHLSVPKTERSEARRGSARLGLLGGALCAEPYKFNRASGGRAAAGGVRFLLMKVNLSKGGIECHDHQAFLFINSR